MMYGPTTNAIQAQGVSFDPRVGRRGRKLLPFVSCMLAASLFVTPTFAEELMFYAPQEIATLASTPSGKTSQSLTLMSDEAAAVRTVRVWYPPNTEFPPHGAMDRGMGAIVTVLAGDMKLAMGGEYDETKLQDLPVGSAFVLTHDNAVHFAKTGPAGAQLMLVIAPTKDLNQDMVR